MKPPGANGGGGYLPQVDGLRGLAILAVVFHHFGVHPHGALDWGPIGPVVFFMLSGYFITQSLWKIQGRAAEGSPMLPLALGFHARRIFRILPAVILLLVIGGFLGMEECSTTWPWHLAFLTNFLVIFQREWIGSVSHLWSLSLQEQFYLLSTLILFVPRAYFVRTMLVAIAAAGIFRLVCILYGSSEYARWLLLPGSLDAFATGGLAAWLVREGYAEVIFRPRISRLIAAGAVVSLVVSRFLRFLPDTHLGTAAVETFQAVFFLWLLLCLVANSTGMLSRIFLFRPLVFLGRVSFGIFVFHTLVAYAAAPALRMLPESPLLRAVILVGLSVAVAVPSYHLLEQPMNRLAKRLDFGKLGRSLSRWGAFAGRRVGGAPPQ